MQEKTGRYFKGDNKNEIKPWPYIIGLSIFVFVVLALYLYNFHSGFAPGADAWGQFGDYIGGVLNPVLSFCAFVGLLITLRGQHAESVKVEERHRAQVFDTRLFQMISLFSESAKSAKLVIKGDYRFPGSGYSMVGHEAVSRAWEELKDILTYIDHDLKSNDLFTGVLISVTNWRAAWYPNVEDFFHSLILLLTYASFDAPGESQKKFAHDIVGGQINSNERVLLFYVLLGIELDSELLSELVSSGFFSGTFQDPLYRLRPQLLKESELNHSRLLEVLEEV